MTRLRHRPDQFFYRGDRFAFHRLQDGATLGRLDPYSAETQRWLLHSGRTIDVTAEEVRDITKQVHDLDLPDMRPGGGSCNCGERLSAIEARLAVLEAAPLAPPPPAPVLGDKLEGLEELRAKIDRVRATGSIDPSNVDDLEPLKPDDLINMVADNPPGSAAELEEAVRAIKGEARRRFSEQLNVELAELKNSRGLAGEDLQREQQVEYLLGLFARLGEI